MNTSAIKYDLFDFLPTFDGLLRMFRHSSSETPPILKGISGEEIHSEYDDFFRNSSNSDISIVEFRVADIWLAVPIDYVNEVIMPKSICKSTSVRCDFCKGLIIYQNKYILSITLQELFKICIKPAQSSNMLILSDSVRSIAVDVDEILKPTRISIIDSLAKSTIEDFDDFLIQAVRTEHRVVNMLNVIDLLDYIEDELS